MSKYLIGCLISVTIAVLFTFAVGSNSLLFYQVPSFYLLALGIHLIQIIAFIPAKIFNTQKFYDLTGSITFILSTLFCLFISPNLVPKHVIAAAMILLWTGRLGGFLFYRVIVVGEDSRFNKIKKEPFRFFMSWFLQGLWVTITGGPIYLLLTKKASVQTNFTFSLIQILGIILWIVGIVIEIISDSQKFKFKLEKKNEGKFMKSGIWKYSRHPNYCGEIILWFGATIFVSSSLEGRELISLISPFFVYFLLTKVSGIPLLESKAEKVWGNSQQYRIYKAKTPILFPWGSNSTQKGSSKTN